MAWTAPATWSVAEVVTASKMNTHVRDNLKYLKGQAGPVTIEDRLTLPLVSGTDGKGLRLNNGSADFATLQSLDATGQSYIFFANNRYFDGTAWQAMNARAGAIMNILDNEWIYYSSAAGGATLVERMRMAANGNFGIGTAAPQGKVHAVGAVGNSVHLDFNGVDATLRTLLTAGSVTAVAAIMYAVKSSAGGTTTGITNTVPGGQTDYADGSGSTLRIAVTAGGALTLQRVVSGTSTFKVALWVVYI